jgi:hypothetical protein
MVGKLPPLEDLTRDELGTIVTFTEWLTGVVDGLPSSEALARAVARAELLYPLRQLAGTGFVGRESELQRLADYVGVLPIELSDGAVTTIVRYSRRLARYAQTKLEGQQRPLFLHGPGGVGKSTLLARFVLEHSTQPGPTALPFVLLDIDKPSIEPLRPPTFLLDALGQLQNQLEGLNEPARALSGKMIDSLNARETSALEAIINVDSILIREFARLINPLIAERPLLFIVDTFEEVQFLGPEVVYIVLEFVNELQRAMPQVRLIFSGRIPPNDHLFYQIPVRELPQDAARTLIVRALREHGREVPPKNLFDDLLNEIGGNPMVLRLAARLIADQDFEGLHDAVGRRERFKQVRVEALQARLYGRILGHLHDANLKKLAFPGLLVRRITPAVISEVLNEPCGLDLDTPDTAESLFHLIEEEMALVTLDPVDGSLKFRPDIRRVMLQSMDDKMVSAKTARTIDLAAVSHWSSRKGPTARAEELYHRLRLGQKRDQLEKCWAPEAAPLLRGAIGELEGSARTWLANKLGISVDEEARADALQADWEDHAARIVQRLLEGGQAQRALKVLQERPERSAGSPLYALEVRALYTLNELDEAQEVVLSGLDSMRQANNADGEADLRLLLALIMEQRNDFVQAREQAQIAEGIAASASLRVFLISALLRLLRLDRMMDQADTREYRSRRDVALQLIREDQFRSVSSDATLLRDAAAELGDLDLRLLNIALQQLGVDVFGNTRRDLVAQLLHEISGISQEHVAQIIASDRRELALVAVSDVRRLLGHPEPSRPALDLVVRVFQEATDRAVKRLSSREDDAQDLTRSRMPTKLSGRELKHVTDLIAANFGTEELRRLVKLYLSRDMNRYVSASSSSLDQIFMLLDAAMREGWIADLLAALAEARPENNIFQSVFDK